jgi:cytidylate kinase
MRDGARKMSFILYDSSFILSKRPVIAIDGPAGSGKSTVAAALAQRLGFAHIETGAMYRAAALAARRSGIGPEDRRSLAQLCQELPVELKQIEGGQQRVLLGGEDVTGELRSDEIARLASEMSVLPEVREPLVRKQRDFARQASGKCGVVMEGRDIQTVVLPDADLKVFLTASPEERARRLLRDLAAQGKTLALEQAKQILQERDARDSNRAESPLRPAEDAVVIDTTGLSVEQVVERIAGMLAPDGEA